MKQRRILKQFQTLKLCVTRPRYGAPDLKSDKCTAERHKMSRGILMLYVLTIFWHLLFWTPQFFPKSTRAFYSVVRAARSGAPHVIAPCEGLKQFEQLEAIICLVDEWFRKKVAKSLSKSSFRQSDHVILDTKTAKVKSD